MDHAVNGPVNEAVKPFGPTSRSLPIALLRARETVLAPIREMLHASNISEQKWRVLRVVEEAGEMEQTAISLAACLKLPSLTRILRTMEAEKLISRKTDKQDRRRTLVQITEVGRMLIESHLNRNSRIFSRLESQYGRDKMDQLLDMLEELQQVRL
ncbi:MAG: homoprotocatechuate degradation operon regulator HpaR [Nitratireductor sp.]|nr:homoprotocatechuate degradation operon regulator HpaR [Nitratireductor sp.]